MLVLNPCDAVDRNRERTRRRNRHINRHRNVGNVMIEWEEKTRPARWMVSDAKSARHVRQPLAVEVHRERGRAFGSDGCDAKDSSRPTLLENVTQEHCIKLPL